MKKLLLVLFVCISFIAYSQPDTVAVVGQDPNNRGGDSKKEMQIKANAWNAYHQAGIDSLQTGVDDLETGVNILSDKDTDRPYYGIYYGTGDLANTNIGRYANRESDYKFTCEWSGYVTQITLYCVYATSPGYYGGDGGELKVAICTDDGTASHNPTDTEKTSITDTSPMSGVRETAYP